MVKARYKITEVKEAIKKLSAVLMKSGIKTSAIFLYGSYARGNPRNYSDIDVAIISPDFRRKDRLAIQEIIAKALSGRTGILSAIEPIGYSSDEFIKADKASFLGEIKRTGKRLG